MPVCACSRLTGRCADEWVRAFLYSMTLSFLYSMPYVILNSHDSMRGANGRAPAPAPVRAVWGPGYYFIIYYIILYYIILYYIILYYIILYYIIKWGPGRRLRGCRTPATAAGWCVVVGGASHYRDHQRSHTRAHTHTNTHTHAQIKDGIDKRKQHAYQKPKQPCSYRVQHTQLCTISSWSLTLPIRQQQRKLLQDE